jgi:hypothetical protein
MKEYVVFRFKSDSVTACDRKPITQEYFEEFKQAQLFCINALKIEEAFALLVRGYMEFENELLKQAQKSIVWQRSSHDESMNNMLELNFRLISFLTMTLLYSDMTNKLFGEMFGKKSQNHHALCELKKRKQADDNYRFVSNLRDYSQHESLPFNAICTIPLIRKIGSPEQEVMIIPKMDKHRFKNREGHYPLRGITIDKDGRIDIRKPLREYLVCVYQIQNEIRKMTDVDLPRHQNMLIQTKADYSCSDGVQYDPTELQCLENDKIIDSVSTFTRFIELYDNHRRMNVLNDKLPLFCVSSYSD